MFDFVADERNPVRPKITDAGLLTGEPIGAGIRLRSVVGGFGAAVEMTVEATADRSPGRLATTPQTCRWEP